MMCTPTQDVWQPAGCVSCELVCVCVSLVRVVIICLASTHTALVSSPSLTVLHLTTYIPPCILSYQNFPLIRPPARAISHLPYTKHYSHDTRGSGGAAAAAAVARAGGRTRTGRSSDRLGGRCSVCQSAPSAQLERSQVHREAWRRGDARRRWRAGERPARGEADR